MKFKLFQLLLGLVVGLSVGSFLGFCIIQNFFDLLLITVNYCLCFIFILVYEQLFINSKRFYKKELKK
jgi:hypothetical protein